jgi:protein-glutamine gamma-glutamyltransferase
MILIGGSPAQPEFLSTLPSNGTEKQIVGILSASTARYQYDSADQLKFELRLRSEIVDAARSLDRSGMDFEIFRKSRCNQAFWNRTSEGGFLLKSGASPSGAIRDIYRNGSRYATECATAMVIVYYGALLAVFGPNRFDRLFPEIELMNWHHIDRLLSDIGLMKKRPDYLPGDRRYFTNPDVDPLTPEWQGENVIDLNGKLYYGHGAGIMNADAMVRMLNESRAEGADESAYLMDSAAGPDYKSLAAIYARVPDPAA